MLPWFQLSSFLIFDYLVTTINSLLSFGIFVNIFFYIFRLSPLISTGDNLSPFHFSLLSAFVFIHSNNFYDIFLLIFSHHSAFLMFFQGEKNIVLLIFNFFSYAIISTGCKLLPVQTNEKSCTFPMLVKCSKKRLVILDVF